MPIKIVDNISYAASVFLLVFLVVAVITALSNPAFNLFALSLNVFNLGQAAIIAAIPAGLTFVAATTVDLVKNSNKAIKSFISPSGSSARGSSDISLEANSVPINEKINNDIYPKTKKSMSSEKSQRPMSEKEIQEKWSSLINTSIK
jgi:hypothetical protein